MWLLYMYVGMWMVRVAIVHVWYGGHISEVVWFSSLHL